MERKRRFSERLTVAARPAMREAVERIAVELDEPVTETLRRFVERGISAHDRAAKRRKGDSVA